MVKQFEIGKCYQHSGGGPPMFIAGMAATEIHGICFIGEEMDGSLHPISMDDSGDSTIGWSEISKEQFLAAPVKKGLHNLIPTAERDNIDQRHIIEGDHMTPEQRQGLSTYLQDPQRDRHIGKKSRQG